MSETGTRTRGTTSPFVPLFLIAAALLLWVTTQTWTLYGARTELRTARVEQEDALQQSRQVRAQLQSIVEGMTRLARSGNPNARRVVEALQQQGIRIVGDDS